MHSEIRRQALHIFGIVIILPLLYLSYLDAIKILSLAILFFFLASSYIGHLDRYSGQGRFRSKHKSIYLNGIKPVLRPNEFEAGNQPITFVLGVLLTLIFFGAEIAIVAAVILAVGDAVSTLVGRKFGRNPLLYNQRKSLEGTIAFFLFALIAIYLAITYLRLEIPSVLLISTIVALTGALTESLPDMNDNVSIPIITGTVLFVVLNYVI